MDDQLLLKALLEVAENADIEVRQAALGGEGGGLCVLRGKKILFVDISADLAEEIARTAQALAQIADLEQQYLLPQVRQVLQKHQNSQ
ncbi:MAG: hypothetical protein GY869_29665 [Planctomycetes bacterium]|nr:hypothetical protein [Planctomycetota bacterium]